MKNIFLLVVSFLLTASVTLFANSDNLYIVSSDNGVKVREDALMQTESKVVALLNQDTLIRQIDELQISKQEKWGKFIFKNDKNTKVLGWIRMDLVSKVNYK